MIRKLMLLLLSSFVLTSSAFADRGEVGPRGGKLLENIAPRAEFFILPDRHVSIIFVDENKKPTSVNNQEVSVKIAAAGKTSEMKLIKKGDEFLSSEPLVDGDGHLITVQIKKSATEKPENFRVKFESHICGGCAHAEYACTCDE